MPSTPHTTDISRRRLLAATGGCLSASVAGCVEAIEGIEYESSSDADESVSSEPYEASDDLEYVSVRAPGEMPFVFSSADDAEEAEYDDSPTARARAQSTVFVTDEAAGESLYIDYDGDGVDDARAFVDATDFESQTVVVEQRRIDDCYRRALVSVSARDDEFRTQYCRELQPATAPCDADATEMQAFFIRVDRPYSDRPSRRGGGESGSCPDRVWDETDSSGEDDDERDGADGGGNGGGRNGENDSADDGEHGDERAGDRR